MENEILTLDELRELRRTAPERLFKHLTGGCRDFVFGVEDHRKEPEGWGGEYRLIVNRNIELHFVPRFNEAMGNEEELPQFTVMPDAELAGTENERDIKIDDEDSVQGVTFFIDPELYDRLLEELAEVVTQYADFDVIPDTYFLETELVHFLETRVLEHSAARTEREFDFRRGLVGGRPPKDTLELDHDRPDV